MTSRLAVTQEQAEDIASAFAMKRAWESVTLRLPERPTMPCPCGGEAHPAHALHSTSSVPIPEGTRVRIEYPCDVCDGSGRGSLDGRPQDWLMCGECNGKGWHPVAFATLAEVHDESCLMPHSPDCCGYCPGEFVITLSDIKPVEADQ